MYKIHYRLKSKKKEDVVYSWTCLASVRVWQSIYGYVLDNNYTITTTRRLLERCAASIHSEFFKTSKTKTTLSKLDAV